MIIYTYSFAQQWGRNSKHRALKNSYCPNRRVNIESVDIEVQYLRDINKKKQSMGNRNQYFDDCSMFMIAQTLMEFYFPNIKIRSFIRLEDGIKKEMLPGYNFMVKMLPQ